MAVVTQSFEVAALGASKANVVQSASLPTLPPADAATLSLKNVESHRQVEINQCITQLRDFVMENDFAETITIVTLSMPLGGGKSSIVSGVAPEDNIVILTYSNEGGNDHGTEVFTAMIEYCRMAMRDNYLKLL